MIYHRMTVSSFVFCILLLLVPCAEAVKVSIEKTEVFSDSGEIVGHTDFSAEQLSALGVTLVADYETYIVGSVAEASVEAFSTAVARAGLISHIRREYDLIQINGFTFSSFDSPRDLPADLSISSYHGALGFYLVQFAAPVKASWRSQVDSIADIIAYIPENTYVVRLPSARAHLLSSIENVQHVSLFQPAYKIQRDLLNADQLVDVTIQFDHGQDLTDVAYLLGQLAGETVNVRGETDARRARTSIDSSDVRDIAHWPEVLWIEPTLSVEFSGERQAMIAAGQHNGTRPNDPDDSSPRAGYHKWLKDKGFCTPTEAPRGCNPYWTKVGVFDSGLDVTVCPENDYDPADGTCDDWDNDYEIHPNLDHASNLSTPCVGLSADCTGDVIKRFFCSEDLDDNNQCYSDSPGEYSFSDDDQTTQGHGTSVASIIAGDSLDEVSPIDDDGNFYAGTGLAPSAQIIMAKLGPLYGGTGTSGFSEIEYKELMTAVEAKGARFANNSWNLYSDWYAPPEMKIGITVTQTSHFAYNGFSQMADRLVRDAKGTYNSTDDPMTIVFSAGNRVAGPQWVFSPANAKNVISVGASRNWALTSGEGAATSCTTNATHEIDEIAGGTGFHSPRMYWSEDDTGQYLPRYKPDVVAPGTKISAARTRAFSENGLYKCFFGTSAAAPAVTSAAILADAWYYYEMTNSELPSPAMVKAMLLAHADTMNGGTDYLPNPDEALTHSPSPPQGWGRINMDGLFQDTYDFVVIDEDHVEAETRRFTDSGDYWTDVFEIDDSNEDVIIAMVYTDYPSEPMASGGLQVNDLDLKAYTYGFPGKTYWGNYFNGQYSLNAASIPRYIPDPRNTVEIIRIEAGEISGQFTIRISGRTISENAVPGVDSNGSNQDWALYVYNASVY